MLISVSEPSEAKVAVGQDLSFFLDGAAGERKRNAHSSLRGELRFARRLGHLSDSQGGH